MTYIISELHGQHGGSLSVAEQMILQSKFGGADAVKVQLYDSLKLFGDHSADFLSYSFNDVVRLKKFADQLNIEFFASVFDEERLQWALDLDFSIIKIANRTAVNQKDLCEKIIATGKRVLLTLNDEQISEGKPYEAPNVEYLYTKPVYPSMLEEINMPDFEHSFLSGYSDHTIGLTAAVYALSRGAKIIEKHFTISHSWQKTREKAHACGMNYEELAQLRAFSRGINILKYKKVDQYEG